MPRQGRILEAGCGLGQYVLLLRERGWQAAGVDWSVQALAACRRTAPAPLAAMELTALACRDAAFAGYVSLGVVEHDPNGPDAILAEARRVLAPGGVIVISVPYLNGVRRLGAPWLRRRARAIARHGGEFYQYAFTRRELLGALARHGFAPETARPYDPARVLGRALPRALRARLRAPAAAGAPGEGSRTAGGPPRRGMRALVRRALYADPALRLFGHMLLVVARKR